MKAITTAAFVPALLLSLTGSFAASKVTAGVGHMCCGKCRAVATFGMAKVADEISIEGTQSVHAGGEDRKE